MAQPMNLWSGALRAAMAVIGGRREEVRRAPTADAAKPSKGVRAAASAKGPRIVWREGSYPAEVVGESRYREALLEICGGYSREGHDIECDAELVPEPTNAHDPNAVMVVIQDRQVGYLPSDRAAEYLGRLEAAGHAGQRVVCRARIRGGWRTNQHDSGDFGVKLALPARGALKLS